MSQIRFMQPNPVNPIAASDIVNAWNEWKGLRALLSTTIHKYVAACSNLNVAWSQSLDFPQETLAKDVYTAISSELEATSSDEEALYRARLPLAMLRNSFSSINKLPFEILAKIFMVSTDRCMHDSRLEGPPGALRALSAVSVHWRRVALNTPALWTHLDIYANLGSHQLNRHVEMLLQRSRGLQLHLHVREARCAADRAGEDQLLELEKLLTQCMARVSTLEISTHSSSELFTQYVLGFWLKHSASGSVKSLTVFQPERTVLFDLTRPLYFMDDSTRTSHVGQVLQPIRILRSTGVFFRYDSPLYHGLVDLQLVFQPYFTVPIQQFAHILLSSPELDTLKLSGIHLAPSSDWDASTTVHLNSLKVLNLVGVYPNCLRLLLPLISPSTDNDLSVGITFNLGTETSREVQAFFQRSRITRLYIKSRDQSSVQGIIQFRGWLPNIQSLALEAYHMRRFSPLASAQLPPLRELILVDCRVDEDPLVEFVDLYGVRVLHLNAGCWIPPGFGGRGTSYESSEGLHDELVRRRPQLDCTLSGDDVISDWPCCNTIQLSPSL